MGHLATLATCQLNQWALDFDGNLDRILQSIRQSKAAGATLRVGPELEITGYGCLDHFLESDTFLHSWDSIAAILKDKSCYDILLDIGAPIMHQNVRYNCRILCFNGQILLIRPKLWLANDGNYREMRYFTPWQREKYVEEYYLPRIIQEITGKIKVPIGDALISTRDTCLGCETCEELFTPSAPHSTMSLNGCEIFTNSSGSHWELRKLKTRYDLIIEATRKAGGIYLYANQQGCDGDRLYYDGSAMIVINGNIVAQASQFSLSDVEVITATVDLEEVRAFRVAPSRGLQATHVPKYERIELDYSLSTSELDDKSPSKIREPTFSVPEEEIALGPACYLWCYLRRSHQAGFFIPLSGGIDSCATSILVFSMCRMVVEACKTGNQQVLKDAQTVCGDETWQPSTPQEFCGRIFHTCFMGSVNSSKETRGRARDLAKAIGAHHTDLNIDNVVNALTTLFTTVTNYVPNFTAHGGTPASNLALQNIQARIRMVIAYLFAQLLPTVRGRKTPGSLLVLGSANVDESLRGYLTKYDCSSADINPIGGISKTDLRRFLTYSTTHFSLPILSSFISATPTAELTPSDASTGAPQSDEVDMQCTYAELSSFGTLRKNFRMGPYSMWQRLRLEWGESQGMGAREVYEKVRKLFHWYGINRHKQTVLTPGLHSEAYGVDDNRYDLRPFLYPTLSAAYRKIEDALGRWEKEKGEEKGK